MMDFRKEGRISQIFCLLASCMHVAVYKNYSQLHARELEKGLAYDIND